MEMNRVSISQLNDNIHAWVIRVQAIVYLNDVQVSDEVLQLYSTYYIGSTTVRRLTNN